MEMPPSNWNCEVPVPGIHVWAVDGLSEQRCASASSQSGERKRDYETFRCTSHCEQLQNSKREAEAEGPAAGRVCRDCQKRLCEFVKRTCDRLDVKSGRDAAVTSRRANKPRGGKRAARPRSGALRFYWRSMVNSDLVVARAVTAMVIDAFLTGIVRRRGVPIRKSPGPAIGGLREHRCGAGGG
jgi:hypothetical protein